MEKTDSKISELEARADDYHREATAHAALSRDLEETLRVSDEARRQLTLALDKALAELSNAREAFAALKERLSAAEAELKRQTEIGRRQEPNKQIHAVEQERAQLLAEVNRAMENAETIRREGIEALEEARELKKKAG